MSDGVGNERIQMPNGDPGQFLNANIFEWLQMAINSKRVAVHILIAEDQSTKYYGENIFNCMRQ